MGACPHPPPHLTPSRHSLQGPEEADQAHREAGGSGAGGRAQEQRGRRILTLTLPLTLTLTLTLALALTLSPAPTLTLIRSIEAIEAASRDSSPFKPLIGLTQALLPRDTYP